MKYLKTYEYLTPEIKEFKNNFYSNIGELVKYFFYYEIDSNISYDHIRFYLKDKIFLEIKLIFIKHVIEIRINSMYVNVELFEKTIEFEKYFHSIISLLSFKHFDREFLLYDNKLEKLISSLTIATEEYKLKYHTDKYNL